MKRLRSWEWYVMKRNLRILMAKPGLDGHDRGALVVAMALRDAGIEVIYTGRHQTPEKIVAAAIQEDVDAIGLSIMSGAHMTLCSKIVDLLKEKKADIPVIVGGFIDKKEIAQLKELGVDEVFGVGSDTRKIVEYVLKRLS